MLSSLSKKDQWEQGWTGHFRSWSTTRDSTRCSLSQSQRSSAVLGACSLSAEELSFYFLLLASRLLFPAVKEEKDETCSRVPLSHFSWKVEEPRSTILKSPDGPVTREQLRCCALQCAELLSPHLSGGGSSSTELVALYLQPGPQLIAAVLGVWLAQAAWTPLDRKSPKKRLQELVKQMKPSVVLCDDDSPFKQLEVPVVHAKLSFKVFDRPMVHFEESMDKIAQVIYTSGSTGAPKGVMYTHGRLAHSTHFFAQQCEVRPGCRVLQKTPNIWSVFRHEVYPALSRGGLIVHPDPHLASDPVHLAETINSTSVSLLVASLVYDFYCLLNMLLCREQSGHLHCGIPVCQ